jgi:hypothetical protein
MTPLSVLTPSAEVLGVESAGRRSITPDCRVARVQRAVGDDCYGLAKILDGHVSPAHVCQVAVRCAVLRGVHPFFEDRRSCRCHANKTEAAAEAPRGRDSRTTPHCAARRCANRPSRPRRSRGSTLRHCFLFAEVHRRCEPLLRSACLRAAIDEIARRLRASNSVRSVPADGDPRSEKPGF